MNEEFSLRLKKIENSLGQALSLSITEEWQKGAFGQLPSAADSAYIKKLVEPNRQLIDSGGKRWRPLFLVLCWEALKNGGARRKHDPLSEQETYSLTPLVEFVHTASLIHDDIEDSADLRRGRPAAHIAYGLDTALNAASWLYFVAPMCIDRLDKGAELKLRLHELYELELRRLHLGQAMDIFWHRNPGIFPTEEEYLAMVTCKTGTLSSLAARTGALAAGAEDGPCGETGEAAAGIGIAFQVMDDVINLTRGNPGKKRGDDIVEGKKSLPVILHVAGHPEDKERLAGLFKKASAEGIESSAVEEAIELLSPETRTALERARDMLEKNLAKFSDFPLIQELFYSMIPKL